MTLLLVLLIAAVVFGVLGLFTAIKWLLIVAAVLVICSAVSAIAGRRS